MSTRRIQTPRGPIRLPAFVPVTTFGGKFPLDDLVRPYLPRLAPAVMVSLHYARQMQPEQRPRLPMMVDSGGFAALFEGSEVVDDRGLGTLIIRRGDAEEHLTPFDVLDEQERLGADLAFTLDFPVPPGLDTDEADKRIALSIANARWALENRRRRDMPLFAVAPALDDPDRFSGVLSELAALPFEGFAIGGLVPRLSRLDDTVLPLVRLAREIVGDRPLHALGLGKPHIIRQVLDAGIDSTDSSSYLKLAADGKAWGRSGRIHDPSPTDRLHLALTNLASAASQTLPLSASRLLFSTPALDAAFP